MNNKISEFFKKTIICFESNGKPKPTKETVESWQKYLFKIEIDFWNNLEKTEKLKENNINIKPNQPLVFKCIGEMSIKGFSAFLPEILNRFKKEKKRIYDLVIEGKERKKYNSRQIESPVKNSKYTQQQRSLLITQYIKDNQLLRKNGKLLCEKESRQLWYSLFDTLSDNKLDEYIKKMKGKTVCQILTNDIFNGKIEKKGKGKQ